MAISTLSNPKVSYITEQDIKALINTAAELRLFSAQAQPAQYSEHLSHLSQHVRKVYIVLLHAYELSKKMPLSELLSEIPKSEKIIASMRMLCPDIT